MIQKTAYFRNGDPFSSARDHVSTRSNLNLHKSLIFRSLSHLLPILVKGFQEYASLAKNLLRLCVKQIAQSSSYLR